MIELYHADMSTCAQKIRLLLAEKELEWEGTCSICGPATSTLLTIWS